jgi:hypothetical protein
MSENNLHQQLLSAGLDRDAIGVIIRVMNRSDMPADLADTWAASWDGPQLQDLLRLSPADRQHALAHITDEFLQQVSNRLRRAIHAATQLRDADLRAAGEVAVDLQDLLASFGRDVRIPSFSPFTGKVKYLPLTDVDVETDRAIVEVSTQHDAAGKIAQMGVLLQTEANPNGLPVFHLFPNLHPASRSAQALRAAGSAGVYNDRAALVAAIRAMA